MGKKAPLFQIHRGFLTKDDLDAFSYHLPWLEWQDVPKRLGNFASRIYGAAFSKDYGKLPKGLKPITTKLERLATEQRFTTVFLQKHEKGQFVKPHRNPANYKGYAVIAVFGDFVGGTLVLGKKTRLVLAPGDVILQRCSIGRLARPIHRTEPVTQGTRYTLTLNTIT